MLFKQTVANFYSKKVLAQIKEKMRLIFNITILPPNWNLRGSYIDLRHIVRQTKILLVCLYFFDSLYVIFFLVLRDRFVSSSKVCQKCVLIVLECN